MGRAKALIGIAKSGAATAPKENKNTKGDKKHDSN